MRITWIYFRYGIEHYSACNSGDIHTFSVGSIPQVWPPGISIGGELKVYLLMPR